VLGYVCTSHSDTSFEPGPDASWGAFRGSVATVTYQATLVPRSEWDTYTNTAHVAWTSLPGAIPRTHRRRSAPDSYTAATRPTSGQRRHPTRPS